ncbi:DUF3021 domain-containing protein [Staphylococcus chromogenes]|uniref:DUF3021 domain-containing protein n=1 Tax=Staphylococcus chromogenes TaxID=46126 RepID=UPI000D1A6D4F|nr:DUF3021 domain-containing protein [Staphylococcus chromogenes]MCE4966682.1 DUF3021 domain-containing protein [Staphylococcus chromogenes]PTF75467.1 DUF3021 domain-containing protein [Staphylococcus chromogenes]PTG53305.1 DUF3021 domain-containing protein [Staphylococcus chromogenes]RIM06447.1 DUF3021 domain-containing protein [Staphylococcus chromogenes]
MKLIKNSFMIGVMYGLVISIFFSAIAGHGHYYPLSPMSLMGNFYLSHFSETAVMIISIIIWGCIGILFGQTNRIFEETDWSITRATVTHFVLTYVGFVPLAILAGWFPLNIFALATFTFIFILIYFIIWTYHYKKSQKIVQKINHQIEKR